jgi:DNA-binding HxlR family transcriptional regulator
METITPLAQEGTSLSAGHIIVPTPSSAAPHPAAHSAGTCSTVTDVLSRVGDKWSMQVVMTLGGGPVRFNDLRRAIDGISQRMLTRTLRGLERDGLVSRRVTPSVPPRVDYTLTPLGLSLKQPVAQLGEWAVANRATIAAARASFDAGSEADRLGKYP